MFFDKILDAFKIENLTSSTKNKIADSNINEKYKKALSTINRLSDDSQNNPDNHHDFPISNFLENAHFILHSFLFIS